MRMVSLWCGSGGGTVKGAWEGGREEGGGGGGAPDEARVFAVSTGGKWTSKEPDFTPIRMQHSGHWYVYIFAWPIPKWGRQYIWLPGSSSGVALGAETRMGQDPLRRGLSFGRRE